MLKIYIISCNTELDKYANIRVYMPNVESWEQLEILEINSVFEFFDRVDISTVDNAEEIVRYVIEAHMMGIIPVITGDLKTWHDN